MQTLRKKNSPCKFKNDPTRFLGEGVSFKAKLIGILEVSEARGDRMCQAALADLKMAIRAAGEHKQRIAVQVSIDGLRLRDEKTGDCLYHHPVHKISFIAQDMSDSRAFGYIFGSPDTGHRFFGIKTDKAASQVVIAMRDLFQVVFELKKKEIEQAKQHIEQNAVAIKFHTGGIFVEPAPDTKGAAGSDSSIHRMRAANAEAGKSADRKNDGQSGVIADLLDLQFELNSLQQGIHQMDKITPDNPVASSDDLFESDPFGDSFANMKLKETVQPILPPPPSSSKRGHLERQQTIPAPTSSSTSSPAATASSKTPPPQSTAHWYGNRKKESDDLFNDGELASLAKNAASKRELEENLLNAASRIAPAKSPQIDVFTELDPLGTGLIKPYVDKKDFFQHLKNPPKKVLKDLVGTNSSEAFPMSFNITLDPLDGAKVQNDQPAKEEVEYDDGNFANFDKFEENETAEVAQRPESPRKKEPVSRLAHHQPLSVSLPPEDTSFSKNSSLGATSRPDRSANESGTSATKLPSPLKYAQSLKRKEFEADLARGQSVEKPFPVDFTIVGDSPASPLKSCSSDANSRLSSSSIELDPVPEPPPRGAGSVLINPPPLPPKKQNRRGGSGPPPRPPHGDGHFHYDFLEREEASPSPTGARERCKAEESRTQFDDNFSSPPHVPSRPETTTASAFEDSFSSMMPSANVSTVIQSSSTPVQTKRPKPSLDITLSQLTSSNLAELASSLDMTVQELTSLTLQQLTECLANLSAKESRSSDVEESVATQPTEPVNQRKSGTKVVETCFVSNEPLFKTTFEPERRPDSTYDKYAVFRKLLEMEQKMEVKSDESLEPEPELEKSENLEAEEDPENDGEPQTIVSLVNLTVILPPIADDLAKSDSNAEEVEETVENIVEPKKEVDSDEEEIEKERPKDVEVPLESLLKQMSERHSETNLSEKAQSLVEDVKVSEKEEKMGEGSDENEKVEKMADSRSEEIGSPSPMETVDIKTSTSTSSDRYAALREIIGESEPPAPKNDEEDSSKRSSPALPMQSSSTKSLAEVELLNLFSDSLPPPSSPKKPLAKKDEDLKAVAMDIFEEIKMLNTGTHLTKESKQPPRIPGLEDMFCPFAEARQERSESKDDGGWAKFDTNVFSSDRSSCEGVRSVGGTSPWSPDGKTLHREAGYKAGHYRHSGDSDNEWKDEEESEESNGRRHVDGRFWNGRHSRFEAPIYDDRAVYDLDTPTSGERQRTFRASRKSRSGVPWTKSGHRPCDPSPWHEEGHWEDEPRRYPSRSKVPYKDDEEMQYEARWKCRTKSQRYGWPQESHGPYYDEEKQRKMMLWSDEDRFGSQESPGYDDDDRWTRRKYERRRWDEDARFWARRPPPPDADYPTRESYYYYRESRDRPHDYPPPSSGWDEGYGPERPSDESPRYNPPPGRKRHWPKRPNSANEGRNTDAPYGETRSKFGSRSECGDNDADPYPRPSQRSRSRESYWGSDQECESWSERPYWSEGPDTKSESLHRKRVPRHKARPQQTVKTQSPFEDDFAHPSVVERVESPTNATPGPVESLGPLEPRGEQKREQQPPASPSARSAKDHHHHHHQQQPPRREGSVRDYPGKRSSFFEDDLTPTASASSDASDRPRHSAELKATPEEQPEPKDHQHSSIDSFASEDGRRDSFYNGELGFDDDAFVFKSELEDNVPDHRATAKSARQMKYTGGSNNNNNNNKTGRGEQYIRKSESVNIFAREKDPFDDDDFFN